MAGHFSHLTTNVKEDQLITGIHSQISQLPSSYQKQAMEAIFAVLVAFDNRSSADEADAASIGTTYQTKASQGIQLAQLPAWTDEDADCDRPMITALEKLATAHDACITKNRLANITNGAKDPIPFSRMSTKLFIHTEQGATARGSRPRDPKLLASRLIAQLTDRDMISVTNTHPNNITNNILFFGIPTHGHKKQRK